MYNVVVLTTNSLDTRRRLLRAYLDAVTLSEPLQTRIWHSAQLSLVQVRVLRRLANQPQSQSQLGAELGLAPPSITRLVDRLEARELIARQRDEADRRKVVVTLTDEGRQLVSALPLLEGTAIMAAVDHMSPSQQETIGAAFREFTAAVRQAEEELVGTAVET